MLFRRALLSFIPLCAVSALALATPTPEAQLSSLLSEARAAGCPGGTGTGTPLRASAELTAAARQVSRGAQALEAAGHAGLRASRVFHVSLRGYVSAAQVAQMLQSNHCKLLVDPKLTALGVYREGTSWWVMLAAPFETPDTSDAAGIAARVLALTNEARSARRQCGTRWFEPAPPVQANELLDRAAQGHARDMAQHGYLAHEGRDGSDVGQRVSRTGYRWRAVGENIASGQPSAESAVRDWLSSPPHCAAVMNPSFIDMGIAFAVNLRASAGVYWAQEFGRPR